MNTFNKLGFAIIWFMICYVSFSSLHGSLMDRWEIKKLRIAVEKAKNERESQKDHGMVFKLKQDGYITHQFYIKEEQLGGSFEVDINRGNTWRSGCNYPSETGNTTGTIIATADTVCVNY